MSNRNRVIIIRIPSTQTFLTVGLVGLLVVIALALAWFVIWISREPALSAPPLLHIPNAQLIDKKLNERCGNLMDKMTLEEKAGQLAQYSAGLRTGPGTGREDYDEDDREGRGSARSSTWSGRRRPTATSGWRWKRVPFHIPLLFGYDTIHGQHTIFPVPLALASSFDPEMVRQSRPCRRR